MKAKYLLIAFALVGAALVSVACAPAPTPTSVPPTAAPKPTEAPKATTAPTVALTVAPTAAPTTAPTTAPTVAPTKAPTTAPTVAPTTAPTSAATVAPTKAATAASAASTTAPTAAATKAAASASASATLPATKETPTLPGTAPQSADDLLEVSPQQLKAMIEGGADIIIVDAQPKESYALGHIKGAVNVPWDTKIKPASGLSMSKLMIVYCGCSPDAKASDTDAGDVAMQLVTNYGYRKVAVLGGGWDRWVELKYPVETSK